MNRRSCTECGARLADGAERCDLCGAPQESDIAAGLRLPEPDTTPLDRDDIPDPSGEPEDQLCSECGWKNPHGAHFCSDCGARLQETSGSAREVSDDRIATRAAALSAPHLPRRSATQSPSSTRPASPSSPSSSTEPDASRRDDGERPATKQSDAALTRQVAVLVGLALMVVVALYMVTVVSKQRPPDPVDGGVAAPAASRSARLIQEVEAAPIAAPYRDRVDSMQAAIDGADTTEALDARHQLIDLLTAIGHVDRAAIEQLRLARMVGAPDEWKSAGKLILEWMERSDPETRPEIAVLAIEAYGRVLEEHPDDLESRADLGWAYQYDPQNPMEAIRQTNLVLDADANHLAANYNKGVFLMRINRLEQAHEQFERVQEIAGADSPYYQRAQIWIDAIQETREERSARQ